MNLILFDFKIEQCDPAMHSLLLLDLCRSHSTSNDVMYQRTRAYYTYIITTRPEQHATQPSQFIQIRIAALQPASLVATFCPIRLLCFPAISRTSHRLAGL